MTLHELLPQLKELNYKEKSEAVEFLQKELATDEFASMEESAAKVRELLEKHPEPTRDYTGIAGVEAGTAMMEYMKKTKV